MKDLKLDEGGADGEDMEVGDDLERSNDESDEEVNKKSKLASTSQDKKPGLFNFDLAALNASNKVLITMISTLRLL